MLDIRWIRENAEALEKALADRGAETAAVAELIDLDDRRRAAIQHLQELQTRRNAASGSGASFPTSTIRASPDARAAVSSNRAASLFQYRSSS